MDRSELAGWLRLCATPGLTRAGARRLLAAWGSPRAVLAAAPADWASAAGRQAAQALRTVPDGFDALVETTQAWLDSAPQRHAVVALGDPLYPAALLETEDPPTLLHLQGRLDLLADAGWPQTLAVVGSRNPTAQGADNARQFAASLCGAGWCIASGLALGVDAAAHEGALAAATGPALRTIALVATGLDQVYPARHRELAGRIAAQGLVASEFALGTPPLQQHFPQRNRIISGLARGTLVVEATLRSGSLITARMAAEQGREVFAIPGSIHAPQSRGCHALIRQGAKLVETAQDVLDELGGDHGVLARPAAPAPVPARSGREKDPLLSALGQDPQGLDALVARTGWPAGELQSRLMELELDGQVARLPGGLYQRRAHG